MSNGHGWVTHPEYGQVFQPDVAHARSCIHNDMDRWFGEEYDNLSDLLDDLQKAAERAALTDLLRVLVGDGNTVARDAVLAMLKTIDAQQHGEKSCEVCDG